MSTSPAHLEAAIAESAGAAAVITGSRGSGKSALLHQLERRASAAGWLTRRATHTATERYIPYTAIRELFDPAPTLLDSPTRPIAETALSVYWHCASIARQVPVALFVDDAQWADRASLRILAQLARRTRDLPLLVVLATRPHDGEGDPDVPAIFGAIAGVQEVRLQRRPTRSEADSAWAGLQAGGLGADMCAVLARSALLHDPHSLKALRTLILTDRVAEAEEAIACLGDKPAASHRAAELALRVGRRADAEREARRALALGAPALDVLVSALIGRGATGEARAALDRRDAPAGLLLAEGDFDTAVTVARDEGWRRTAKGQTNPARSGWRSTLALALTQAGQLEEAAAVADDEIALARAFGAPTPLTRALHARCVAEPDLEPRAELAAAVLEIPAPATLLHASARVEFGIAQLRLGHPADARDALNAAVAVADAAGALPMAERARRALAAAGPGRSPRTILPSGPRGARRAPPRAASPAAAGALGGVA